MLMALSTEEESQRSFRGGNGERGRNRLAGELRAAGMTAQLAGTVRLVGVSRSAYGGYRDKTRRGAAASKKQKRLV